jgi:hypothetical protein
VDELVGVSPDKFYLSVEDERFVNEMAKRLDDDMKELTPRQMARIETIYNQYGKMRAK